MYRYSAAPDVAAGRLRFGGVGSLVRRRHAQDLADLPPQVLVVVPLFQEKVRTRDGEEVRSVQ